MGLESTRSGEGSGTGRYLALLLAGEIVVMGDPGDYGERESSSMIQIHLVPILLRKLFGENPCPGINLEALLLYSSSINAAIASRSHSRPRAY